ncbi:MAG: methionine adenosyltransferase [Saccharofermentanales bacterium]
MDDKRYLTAESVSAGHPDKLSDLIADSILDACLRDDKLSRVACEVMATKGQIIIAGEITTRARIHIKEIVRSVLRTVGYDPFRFSIKVLIHKQSPDIKAGVDNAVESRTNESANAIVETGAGDQGTVYGYATDETKEFLPLPLVLSHRLIKQLTKARTDRLISGILPDAKSQVTIEYDGDTPICVKTIIVSTQHEKWKTQKALRKDILQWVIDPVFQDYPIDADTEILINPSGCFILGGPEADTGLTGRKMMVDTYGGLASHGGGAFSGKDPTKVDRSGAYMARYIAKNIVAAQLVHRCEVSISYAIGKANPVAFDINCFGTGKVSDTMIRAAALKVFDLRPAHIIEKLNLRDIHYTDTSVFGHFNNILFPWESTDKTSDLRREVTLLEYTEIKSGNA